MSHPAPARRKPLTILDLRDSPWVDGPGRTILDCATSLKGSPYQLIVGSFDGPRSGSNAYEDEARRRSLTVVSIKESKAFDLRVLTQILRLVDQQRVDVIHTHDFRSNLFGLICAKLRRKPIVTTTHGWIANSAKRKLFIKADKLLLRFFDHVIAVSDRTASLVRRAGVAAHKIAVIPNALTVEKYVRNRTDDSFRRELKADPSTVLIANIGRLSPEKGQLPFLQAARELVRRYTNLKFVLIGIGPDRAALDQYVSENGLADHVVFAGFREDMLPIYNSLDLVVQSSHTEGMPNVILEALLMQVPVIATDVGGTAEIVEHGRSGVLIAAGDVTAITDSVADFLRQREHHGAMAAAGRQVILERFNHRQRVERLKNVYDRVAAR